MFLFRVDNTFLITGVGLVLTPGFGNNRVKVGISIRLIRPDGSVIETRITGIVFGVHHISVGAEIKKDDVPLGTEVWLNE
jgi:hypothetical protein